MKPRIKPYSVDRASGLQVNFACVNKLLFGDNLKWLRDTKIFPDASVDLASDHMGIPAVQIKTRRRWVTDAFLKELPEYDG